MLINRLTQQYIIQIKIKCIIRIQHHTLPGIGQYEFYFILYQIVNLTNIVRQYSVYINIHQSICMYTKFLNVVKNIIKQMKVKVYRFFRICFHWIWSAERIL